MNFRLPDGPIRITVKSRGDMDSQLERAVRSLIEKAPETGDRRIMVTRHSPRDFTVELHPSVPFGLTQEKKVNW